MKQTFIIIALLSSVIVHSQTSIPKFVKLTQKEINFLEETYDWKSDKLLILNIIMPRKRCNYDNYKNLSKAKLWWTKFYEKVDLTKAENRFIYSEATNTKSIVDNKMYFLDRNNYIFNEFFSNDEVCFGVVVIDKTGNFKYKAGEYSEVEINDFINKLSKP